MALARWFPAMGRYEGGPGSNGCSKEFSENKNYSQKFPFTGILYGDVPKWLKGPHSKTNALFGSSPLKKLDFTGLFGYH